jgi:hypothetical protein
MVVSGGPAALTHDPPRCPGGCGKIDVEEQRLLTSVGLWEAPAGPGGFRNRRMCDECWDDLQELLARWRQERRRRRFHPADEVLV